MNAISLPQPGGWFNKKIKSVEDFKGLRMRIPGMGAEVLKRMGVVTVHVGSAEFLNMLEDGTLDAAEWVDVYFDLELGLHKFCKYFYATGWHVWMESVWRRNALLGTILFGRLCTWLL